MPADSHDPTTWPPETIVVRCWSAQGIRELADRLSRDGSWSVFAGPPHHHELYGLTPQQFDAILGVTGVESSAEIRSVDAVVITLEADFNHMDAQGRLRLGDLRMHDRTPFAEIAAKHETIIFVDGEDMVRGQLIFDPQSGWMGQVDWSTQDVWESYPPAVAARR